MTDAHVDAIERWALDHLDRLSEGGRRGVLLGGNIARGQQWAHSDLEAGLLTEEHDPPLAYFNVDSGRGVEIIQLTANDLARQVERSNRSSRATCAPSQRGRSSCTGPASSTTPPPGS